MNRRLAPVVGIALLISACSTPQATETPAPSSAPAETVSSSPGPATPAPATSEPVAPETPAHTPSSTPPPAAPMPQPPPPAPAPPAPPAPPAQPGTQTSIRGNLIKQIGETAGIRDANGEYLVTFVVNSISNNVVCSGPYAGPSENGVFVAVEMSVQTSPNMLNSDLIESFSIDASGFTAIGPDGVTSNVSPYTAASLSCLSEADSLPTTIGPGENVRGKVLLDLQSPSGTLVFEDWWTDSAWEWTYPG